MMRVSLFSIARDHTLFQVLLCGVRSSGSSLCFLIFFYFSFHGIPEDPTLPSYWAVVQQLKKAITFLPPLSLFGRNAQFQSAYSPPNGSGDCGPLDTSMGAEDSSINRAGGLASPGLGESLGSGCICVGSRGRTWEEHSPHYKWTQEKVDSSTEVFLALEV